MMTRIASSMLKDKMLTLLPMISSGTTCRSSLLKTSLKNKSGSRSTLSALLIRMMSFFRTLTASYSTSLFMRITNIIPSMIFEMRKINFNLTKIAKIIKKFSCRWSRINRFYLYHDFLESLEVELYFDYK